MSSAKISGKNRTIEEKVKENSKQCHDKKQELTTLRQSISAALTCQQSAIVPRITQLQADKTLE